MRRSTCTCRGEGAAPVGRKMGVGRGSKVVTIGGMRWRRGSGITRQAKVKSQLEFKVGVRTVVCSRPLDKGANEYTLSKFHKTPCFIWGYWV